MYSTIILNIGGWKWMDASMQLWMMLRTPSVFGICHQFGLPGLVLCCWARFSRIIYINMPKEGSIFPWVCI